MLGPQATLKEPGTWDFLLASVHRGESALLLQLPRAPGACVCAVFSQVPLPHSSLSMHLSV